MRIISGSLGGRKFDAPRGHHTHPMSERIRGAIFNVLGDIEDLTVLDAFAGSGALSLEAISRGAKQALLIDNDTEANRTLVRNIELLDLDAKAQVIQGNISGWSNNHAETFDLVFCDPPYDAVPSTLIQKLSKHVAPAGLLILSWPSFVELPALNDMVIVSQKKYGNATLAFYKKTG